MEISVLEKKYPPEFVSRMKDMLGEEYPAPGLYMVLHIYYYFIQQ